MFCLVHWSPIRCFDQSMRNKVPQQNSNTSWRKSALTLHFFKLSIGVGYVPRYPIFPGKTFPGSSWRRREPPWCRASPWGWAIPRPLLPNSSPSRWQCRSELQELCHSIRKRWILLGKKNKIRIFVLSCVYSAIFWQFGLFYWTLVRFRGNLVLTKGMSQGITNWFPLE